MSQAIEQNDELLDQLLLDRFLMRGQLLTFAGPADLRDDYSMNLAIHLSLGRPLGPFIPCQPLRVTMLHPGYSRSTLHGDFRQAAYKSGINPEDCIRNLRFLCENSAWGIALGDRLREVQASWPSDVIIVDHASAMLGGQPDCHCTVNRWIGDVLLPAARERGFGLILVTESEELEGSIWGVSGARAWGDLSRSVVVLEEPLTSEHGSDFVVTKGDWRLPGRGAASWGFQGGGA